MNDLTEPLPAFLADPSRIGTEISVTGKWVPTNPSGRFRASDESRQLLAEWEDVHADARSNPGLRSTEINHAVGEDGVLVHHVFADAAALVDYFATTATEHLAALRRVARPELQLVRGVEVPGEARTVIEATGAPVAFGEWIYGYVRDEYRRPDPATAVQVTAKWTCGPDGSLDELRHWWQRVGTDANDLEPGLVRFEAYEVTGEDALIIHETFTGSDELKFHLTRGTAHAYKKHIDRIAAPETYYFRGPVAWTIRTYSRFMHLPATYSSRGSHHTEPGGSHSDGLA